MRMLKDESAKEVTAKKRCCGDNGKKKKKKKELITLGETERNLGSGLATMAIDQMRSYGPVHCLIL